MHDEWTDLMSAALDGELDPVSMRRLEAHLATCTECAGVYADLQRLVAAAPAYAGQEPAVDLWPRIRARIGRPAVLPFPGTARRAVRFGVRELIAAGLVMATAGAVGTWYFVRATTAPVVAVAPEAGSTAPLAAESPAAFASAAYDSALAELSHTLAERRGRLDTATVRVLEQSIQTIDRAVAEARAAIQRDSANAYLNGRIAANLRQKLNLLRAATRAINSET